MKTQALTLAEAQAIAAAVHRRYLDRYDGEIQGCCHPIAAEIIARTGGHPVAGLLTAAGYWRRSHWWVDWQGHVLDPMGDEYQGEPGFKRVEEHRNVDTFRVVEDYFARWALPMDLPRDAERGCSCHINPPCSWCTSLTEEEADAYCSGGMEGLKRYRNEGEEGEEQQELASGKRGI